MMIRNLFLLTFALSSSAMAADYPILAVYKTQAETLLTSTNTDISVQNTEAMKKILMIQTQGLIDTGVKVMNLYSEKKPDLC